MKTINDTPHLAEARIRFDAIAVRSGAGVPIAAPSAIEQVAMRELASRRRRARHFDGPLFHDPAWDIMLDLFIAQCRGEQASLTGAGRVAGIPATTARRIVHYLTKTGLVEQHADPCARDGICLKLSAAGDRGMRGFLAEEAGLA